MTALPAPAPARPVRSGGSRPARLGHRPLQPALHATACPPRAWPGCAKPEMLTDDELVRLVGVFVGLGVTNVRLTGGEPLLRRSLVDVVAPDRRPRAAAADRDDDQRHRPRPAGRAARRRRSGPGQRQPRHHRPRASSPTSPAATASSDVEAGLKAAADAGLTPVKVNAVAMRGVNDERRRRPAAVVPRPRLRAALHRADAARRPARAGTARRWCPRPRSSSGWGSGSR